MRTPNARSLTVFSESRATAGPDGQVYAEDRALARLRLQPEFSAIGGPRVALRTAPSSTTPPGDVIDGDIVALPSYVGLRGLVRVLPRLVRAVRATVATSSGVVVRVPGPLGMLAACMARHRGIPIAAEVVGDIRDVLRSGVAGVPGRALAAPVAWLTRRTVRHAAIVRYVTDHTLQAAYPPSDTAHVVSFSDVSIRARAADAPRRPTPGRVIAVGSQEQSYKGHHLLIEAVARLAPTLPEISLDLVGAGRRQPDLQRLCTQLGVESRVRFLGYISDAEELTKLLDAAEVFAMPSLTEGLPRALIEAMARGIPSIGSRVGGIPELLDDEVIFAPNDVEELTAVLRHVLTDHDFRTRMSLDACHRVRRFAPDQVAGAREAWAKMILDLAQRPVKVVHILGSLNRGGAEMVALDLVTVLTPSEFQQSFLCLGGEAGVLASQFERRGATVTILPGRTMGQKLIGLRAVLKRIAPDTVVSHVSLASGAVLAVAWTTGTPTRIARLHSEADGRGKSSPRRAYRAISRMALSVFATRIVAVTNSALSFGVPRASRRTSAKSVVLGNGVDSTRFFPGPPRADAIVRVLYVGRASPEKNRRALVPIFEELRKNFATEWHVVGPGSPDDLGPLPQSGFRVSGDVDDVAGLLREADVLVLPSTREGLPGVILEALASGVPVVASRLDTLTDLARDLPGVFLVSLDQPPVAWALAIQQAAIFGRTERSGIREAIIQSEYELTRNVDEWRGILRG